MFRDTKKTQLRYPNGPMDFIHLDKEVELLSHPNKVTKDRLNRFKQERTYRCISLHKTAGRQQLSRNSCWSHRPNRRQRPHAFGLTANHPSGRQHKLNKVRHRSASGMEKSPQKRTREMSPIGSIANPVLLDSSDEETATADEDHSVILSPQSPPDHERGHQSLEYMLSLQYTLLQMTAEKILNSAVFLT